MICVTVGPFLVINRDKMFIKTTDAEEKRKEERREEKGRKEKRREEKRREEKRREEKRREEKRREEKRREGLFVFRMVIYIYSSSNFAEC